MPRIETFDAGNIALHPTEIGVDAQAAAARRIGTFYNQQAGAAEKLARVTEQLGSETEQVGRETGQLGSEEGAAFRQAGNAIGSGIAAAGDAAVQYMDHQQISHGGAAYATLLQQTTQQWNSTLANADPNDPNVAKHFMDGLEDKLQSFQNNGFYTENAQKWAEAHVDALRQHFAETTMAGMSQLAGEAVRVNSQQSLNALSSTAHSDPASIDMALASWKSSLEGVISTSPNLGGNAGAVRLEMQQKGAESIVKSAAIGYIEKTGKMPSWVSDPKYAPYVNGTELQQFQKAAQVQAKTELAAQKQIDLYNRQIADQKAHAQANKAFTDNVDIGADGRPVIKPQFYKDALDVARSNPDAPGAGTAARTLLDWGQAQQNRETKPVDNQATVKDLSDRMFSPDKPTTTLDLMKAHAAGEISDHTFGVMNGLVKELEQSPLKGPIWQDTMKAVHDQLVLTNVGIPGKDDVGTSNYAKFIQNFVPQYLAQSRAGTLPANALDVNDPKSMISQAMAPFKRTVQQRIQDYTASLGGSPANGQRAEGGQEVPAPLRGIAALQYNSAKKLWRDQTTGTIYNAQGEAVSH